MCTIVYSVYSVQFYSVSLLQAAQHEVNTMPTCLAESKVTSDSFLTPCGLSKYFLLDWFWTLVSIPLLPSILNVSFQIVICPTMSNFVKVQVAFRCKGGGIVKYLVLGGASSSFFPPCYSLHP